MLLPIAQSRLKGQAGSEQSVTSFMIHVLLPLAIIVFLIILAALYMQSQGIEIKLPSFG